MPSGTHSNRESVPRLEHTIQDRHQPSHTGQVTSTFQGVVDPCRACGLICWVGACWLTVPTNWLMDARPVETASNSVRRKDSVEIASWPAARSGIVRRNH